MSKASNFAFDQEGSIPLRMEKYSWNSQPSASTPSHPVEYYQCTNNVPNSEEEPAPYTARESRAVVLRQDLTILPLSAFIYFLCFIDRSNIGNARILNAEKGHDMQTEIGATPYQFNIALMVFLIGYTFFEVPSNILLKKLRPSRWLAFLMVAWGIATLALGAVKDFAAASGVRFLLGASEAGLFPGLVYYLTFWYRADERSARAAFILASASLGGAFGGAIAYGIGHMDQVRGLSAWRWLFILEGLPSCLSAALVWFFLPDYPEEFYKEGTRQREVALARLKIEGSKRHHKTMTWQDAKATLLEWRLYLHYAIYFGVAVPFSSLALFSPTIIAGLGYKGLDSQLFTVPPYAVSYVIQVLVSYSADRFNARGYHCAGASLVAGASFMVSALLPHDAYNARYICLFFSMGCFSAVGPLLGWITTNVHSTAAVGLAIALNVSIGAGIGQIPGVWIYKDSEKDKGFPTGHWVNAAMLFFVAIGALALRFYYGLKNKELLKKSQGQKVRLFTL